MGKKISSEVSKKYKELIGLKFGNALILSIEESSKDSRLRVNTKCLHCNEISVRRYDHLKRCNPTYCKKCQKETYKKPQKTTPFNKHYGAIKTNANARNLEWSLSKEEVMNITQQNCYYCGAIPAQSITYGRYGHNDNKYCEYIANGLDRIDSKKGYIIENVVPCCGICNIMKNKFSLELFFDRIGKIYANHLEKRSTTSRKT